MTRTLCAVLAGVASLLLGSCRDAGPAPKSFAGTDPVHVRVVFTEAPQHRALIAWSTAELGSDHAVLVAERPGLAPDADDVRRVASNRDGSYVPLDAEQPQPTAHFHHALLEGLRPAKTYWFRVASDGQLSDELHFVTAPDDERPFTLLAGSDSRSDRDGRRAMNRRLRALLSADADIVALAHGGDYEWAGHELDDWLRWLDDHELTTTATGRVLPIIPTRGNHERGPLFDQVFGYPGGRGRNWYATRLSELATLVTLDTNAPGGGPQARFLETALQQAQQARFRVVQYHEPIYPAVKAPVGAAPHWLPLFDELRVDVALESDGHVLKRTPPLRDGKVDATGVVYIGEGGLGVRQRSPHTDRWYLQPPGRSSRALHVWRLDFEQNRLTLRAIGVDGDELDRKELTPR